MKIWIDFINTPQVTFFIPFINDFEKDNHNVILTCRDSGNTVALLKQYNLQHVIIGEKASKSLFRKLISFPLRVIRLIKYIRSNRPDIAVCQSSFYLPCVARVLGIPSLYTNDNEHAKGNIMGFIFAKEVFLPYCLKESKFAWKWSLGKKIFYYPSVKESIYLSQQYDSFSKIGKERKTIFFRPEPWSAQYYNGPVNFFDDVLIKLSSLYEVVVLPRDKDQSGHYSQTKFSNINVSKSPLSLKDIVSDCLLFIGAGGSMTREMAVLGVPVISIYQSELLSVDRYLMEKGMMRVNPDISFNEILIFMEATKNKYNEMSVLKEGFASYDLIKAHIYNL